MSLFTEEEIERIRRAVTEYVPEPDDEEERYEPLWYRPSARSPWRVHRQGIGARRGFSRAERGRG